MLAYAANTPRPAGRAGSPKALTLIIAGHAVLIAAVMSAKMDIGGIIPTDPTDIVDVRVDPPSAPPPEPRTEPRPNEVVTQPRFIEQPAPIVDMDATSLSFDRGQAIEDIATVIGTDISLPPLDLPKAPVKHAAVFRTPVEAVKPPYPNDKLREAEEATLKLQLTIDARGRVIAVEPVGPADPSFLEAARRHIIRAWRYKPATEDGAAVESTTVVTLSFRLEDV